MVRKNPIRANDKALVENIFSIFSGNTYAEIAEKVGKSIATIGAWKAGTTRPTIDDLRRIVEITGVSWEALMGRGCGTSTAPASTGESAELLAARSLIASQQATIDAQAQTIEALKALVELKKSTT